VASSVLEVAQIFRLFGEEYRQEHRLSRPQLRTMRAIEICRTAVLGGHVDECDQCGARTIRYNSCRNRHCPKCQSLDKERWLDQRRQELLPVPYFHVVFTVPHTCVPFLRCHLTRTETAPCYPEEPQSLGEHLKRRRLDLGLIQKEVAKEIRVSKATLFNWEKGRSEPEIRFYPAIIRFLGYDPTAPTAADPALSLGERLRVTRRARGLSQEALARLLGIDPTTVRDLEERGEQGRPAGPCGGRGVFERGRVALPLCAAARSSCRALSMPQ
jgi:transcriptional regulator with XRE-family HTH domain